VRFHESRAHTDPDGRATLQQCVPGRNEVFVWRDRQRLCSGSIEVREGEEAALELTLGLPAGR
jgi:hypothetical protein